MSPLALEIYLQDADGNTLEYEPDLDGVLDKILGNSDERAFELIGFIDPYGNTVFNRLQMAKFLDEWDVLTAKVSSESERAYLGKISALARRVAREPHLYLKFEGD